MIRYLINLLIWTVVWRLVTWFGFMPNNGMTGMMIAGVLPIVTATLGVLDYIGREVRNGR